jgi:hypothetical protein
MLVDSKIYSVYILHSTKQLGDFMGYRVVADKYQMDKMRTKYGPRKGLEGPFQFVNGRVLYYDPLAGEYWDPQTDFYVERDEIDMLHCLMVDKLREPQ